MAGLESGDIVSLRLLYNIRCVALFTVAQRVKEQILEHPECFVVRHQPGTDAWKSTYSSAARSGVDDKTLFGEVFGESVVGTYAVL